MDSLTAAIALVIDNDQHELRWACGITRKVLGAFDPDDARGVIADHLRDNVTEWPDPLAGEAQRYPFVDAAISHMYTHADWRALAQHYIDKVAEGVTVPE